MRYLRIEEKRYTFDGQQQGLKLDFARYDHNELIAILAYRPPCRTGNGAL